MGENLHIEVNVKVNRNISVVESDRIAEWIKEKVEYDMFHISDVLVLVTPVEVVGKKKKSPLVPEAE